MMQHALMKLFWLSHFFREFHSREGSVSVKLFFFFFKVNSMPDVGLANS